MRIGDLETHPAADAFPLMGGDDYERFRADIKAKGLLDRRLIRYKGKLLDGRHRYRACVELGLEPAFVDYVGDDPISFVISANYLRNHWNESQRALIATRLATLKQGRRRKTGHGAGMTQGEAAIAMQVGERSVRRARTVAEQAAPEVIAAIDAGELDLKTAEKLSALSRDAQPAALEQLRSERRERGSMARPQESHPAQAIGRELVRAVQHAGGDAIDFTPDPDKLDLRFTYRGRAFLITLREIGKAAA